MRLRFSNSALLPGYSQHQHKLDALMYVINLEVAPWKDDVTPAEIEEALSFYSEMVISITTDQGLLAALFIMSFRIDVDFVSVLVSKNKFFVF